MSSNYKKRWNRVPEAAAATCFFCFPLLCSLILPYAENLRVHDCLIFHAFQSKSLVRGRYIGRPSCPNAPWNNTSKWEPQQSIRFQCFIPPKTSISDAKVKFFPHSKTDAVFRFQWPCCLSPWDWWASWAFEALGHWSWRCVNLMMFCVFWCFPMLIQGWFLPSVLSNLYGLLFFLSLKPYQSPVTLQATYIFTQLFDIRFWKLFSEAMDLVGSPGGIWWRKWWPDQAMKTTQIHQEILETKSKQSKYPTQWLASQAGLYHVHLPHFSAWNHRVAFLFQKKMIQNLGSWSLGIIHNYLHTWEVIQNKDYISMRCSPSFLQLSNIAKHLQWTLLSEPNFAQKSSGGVFGSAQKDTQWMVFFRWPELFIFIPHSILPSNLRAWHILGQVQDSPLKLQDFSRDHRTNMTHDLYKIWFE